MFVEPDFSAPDPREKKRYYFETTFTRQILTPVVKGLLGLVSVTHATGQKNLPSFGPVVLAANHLTNIDVFLLQFTLDRPIFYMGKAELFKNPLVDAVFRRLGGFPVYRGERDRWAMQHASRVLERGQVLGIFPEGTRSKGSGLRPAKTGAARLAQAAHCPIVPAAIDGTQHLLKGFPRRTSVQIHIGQPIHPQKGETHLELIDRVMFALADLLPPERRGAYRARPEGF